MTSILGISAFYHDSAACLIQDGKLIAAAQEERFTRKKHDERFPEHAIRYCLQEGGISCEDLNFVVFYEKPLLKFDRLLETYLAFAPQGLQSFRKAIPLWIKKKLFIEKELKTGPLHNYQGPVVYPEHHESHAASAFFPSPFEEAAIITIDGVGEWATTTIGKGQGNQIQMLEQINFPHSLGLLYSAFTYYTGFKVNSGEYKLMGLAPYGEPKYVDVIQNELIEIHEDGSFQLNLKYFNYCVGLRMTNSRFDRLFGRPPRKPESPIEQLDMDLAASIQRVVEEVVLKIAKRAYDLTGSKHLCLAGGVALNCVCNGRISREGPFENIWVQPAAGDAGGSLGAALFTWHQLMNRERRCKATDFQAGSLLGPKYPDAAIRETLEQSGAKFLHFESQSEQVAFLAQQIAEGQVVGLHQGRMEFGPRALGGRSILGDPRSAEMQKVMNLKIKFRESFRPFAPSILRNSAKEYFDIGVIEESPYMLFVGPVKPEHRKTESGPKLGGVTGLDRLKVPLSNIPAITHVDCSARVQTVDPTRNPFFYNLIEAFRDATGCPLLINTSFNIRGEPIVCTPEDAYRCFIGTEMDVLSVGSFVLLKSEQPIETLQGNAHYLETFALD